MVTAHMNPWPISPIGTNDLDFAVVNYDFSTFTAQELADLPGEEVAIDATIADLIASLADQTVLIASLFDGLDDFPTILGEIDASPLDPILNELAATATAGDAMLADYENILAPSNTSGGGGGSPAPTPTQSANCGTHGNSNVQLSDNTGDCFASDTLPVVAIADGPCFFPFLMDGSSFAGRVTVTGITLLSGDSQLFSAALDSVTPQGSSTPVSRVTFKLSPYKTGHFLGKFTVHTSTRNPTEIWCLIVDVIQGTATGGGGGGCGNCGPPIKKGVL